MRNKVSSLIKSLDMTAYRFAQLIDTPLTTVYCLQKDPSRIPSGEIMDRIFSAFPHAEILDVLEKNLAK